MEGACKGFGPGRSGSVRGMLRLFPAVGRFLRDTRLVHSFGWGADLLNLVLLLGVVTAAELGWMGAWVGDNSWTVGVAVLAALFLVAGVRAQLQLDSRNQPMLYFTRIAAGPAHSMLKRVTTADATTRQLTGQYEVLMDAFVIAAVVANAPPTFHREAGVSNAVVNVRFFDEAQSLTVPIWESSQGAWGDNPGAAGFDRNMPSEVFRRRDLPANGEEHRIDVAIKFGGSDRLMPWSVPYMRDDNLHPEGFGAGSYIVEFVVTGEGLAVPFARRFRIINPAGTGEPIPEGLHLRKRQPWWRNLREKIKR